MLNLVDHYLSSSSRESLTQKTQPENIWRCSIFFSFSKFEERESQSKERMIESNLGNRLNIIENDRGEGFEEFIHSLPSIEKIRNLNGIEPLEVRRERQHGKAQKDRVK
jgi:hypothetical protein